MNRILIFLVGIISGLILLSLVAGTALFSYKATDKAIDFIDSKINHKEKIDYSWLQKDFFLSFEKNDELKIFEARQTGISISSNFYTDGKNSLLVEYPSGQDFPGICFDVFGKDCFNWSAIDRFSFDVYNGTAKQAALLMKIRSGRQYPKKEFEKTVYLEPTALNTVIITRSELESKLDLDKISAMNLFMHDPGTTFLLYFDRMQVE